MKKNILLFIILLCGLTACENNLSETVTYWVNEPVFMDAETFRSSVKVDRQTHEITGHGKISYYKGYLFMSEPGKGIHIIDNKDPKQPQRIGYIELLGNADLSIRNNLLYADSYVDLVWFDLINPTLPTLKGRLENVFPGAMPLVENGLRMDNNLAYNTENKDKIIVGWNQVQRTVPANKYGDKSWFWRWLKKEGDITATLEMNLDSNASGKSINGSMSRFSIYLDYLYVVLNNNMQVFDLTKPEPEQVVSNYPIGWNVETLFSYKKHMFMGTPTGMLIYSVEDPLKPVYKSSITHAYGCDPVVVSNDIAYVTVRSGNACGQQTNELIIIDVSDTSKPKKLISHKMAGPKGLGIDNRTLFICDEGLKVFDASDVYTLDKKLLAHFKEMDGFDVIPYKNVLMMIADNGIYQYDYSNIKDIKLLSVVPISKKMQSSEKIHAIN